MGVIGYKRFGKDMKCRGFQYEVGKTYEMKESVMSGHNGFHFCMYPEDTERFYSKDNSIMCKVEALGVTEGDGFKYSTNKIKVLEVVK